LFITGIHIFFKVKNQIYCLNVFITYFYGGFKQTQAKLISDLNLPKYGSRGMAIKQVTESITTINTCLKTSNLVCINNLYSSYKYWVFYIIL